MWGKIIRRRWIILKSRTRRRGVTDEISRSCVHRIIRGINLHEGRRIKFNAERHELVAAVESRRISIVVRLRVNRNDRFQPPLEFHLYTNIHTIVFTLVRNIRWKSERNNFKSANFPAPPPRPPPLPPSAAYFTAGL